MNTSCLAAVLLLSLCCGSEDADREVTDLFRRGDALAREKKYAEALSRWKEAYLRLLPLRRGLPFRCPVPSAVLPRDQLESRLVRAMDDEYPEEKIRADVVAGARFGFFAPSFDLRAVYLGMLQEEVAGFYDPDAKELFLVLPKVEPRRWWSSIVGSQDGFDPEEQRGVLAHELSHALADQSFDLYSLQRSVEEDEDTVLAVTALIEGDATLGMMVDMAGAGGGDLLSADPEILSGTLDLLLPLLMSWSGSESYRKAPLLLKETLIFPYLRGLVFCVTLTGKSRWDGVDRAYRDPPVSTEMILHPAKYGATGLERDVPMALALPQAGPLSADEWEPVKENVLGELQTEILLRAHVGSRSSSAAASGWDGDVYRVYRRRSGGIGETCLVWASTWDGESDATEFAQAIRSFFAGSQAGAAVAATTVVEVLPSRTDVVVVHGDVGEDVARSLAAWAAGFTRSEKKVRLRNFDSGVRFAGSELERDF